MDVTIYDHENMIDVELFQQVWQLLECSFPSDERWDYSGFLAEYENEQFRSMVYCPDKLGGVLNFWDFGTFVYVEHFAVAPQLRGNGTGAAMMEELRRYVGARTLVLEAEPPEDSPIAARRIGFYNRIGYVQNPYEYIQPAMGEDEQPIPLVIMSSPSLLTENEFITIRETMYEHVYHGHRP